MELYDPVSIGYLKCNKYGLYKLTYYFATEQANKHFLQGAIISTIQRNYIFNRFSKTDFGINFKTYSKITGYQID